MINIIKTLIVGIVCAAALATATQAADPLTVWKQQTEAAIAHNEAIVTRIKTKYRDVNCPLQPTQALRDTCIAAYNVDIAREQLEHAELQLRVASTALSSSQRDEVIKLVNDYDAFDKQTQVFGEQVDALFPPPKQSSLP